MGWLTKHSGITLETKENTEEEKEEQVLEQMMREIQQKDTSNTYNELLVSGAILGCEYGAVFNKINAKYLCVTISNGKNVLTENVIYLNGGTFGVCQSPSNKSQERVEAFEVPAESSVDGKSYQYNNYPPCKMKLLNEWSNVENEIEVWDQEEQCYRKILTTKSYLICASYGGCIYPLTSGQEVIMNEKVPYDSLTMSKEAKYALMRWETFNSYSEKKGLLVADENKNLIGIRPSYVSDEDYVTCGFGIYLNSDEKAEIYRQYGIKPQMKEEETKNVYAPIDVCITSFNDYIAASEKDIIKNLSSELKSEQLLLYQYEFDALLCARYQCGELGDKISKYLIEGNRNREELYNYILAKHDPDKKKEEFFNRTEWECEMFFNGTYDPTKWKELPVNVIFTIDSIK